MELVKPRKGIITGFMGAGKSEAGLAVANRLGFQHADTDRVFEERHGPIENYLPERDKLFRTLEREIFREFLGSKEDFIISTGGGTLVNDFTGIANCDDAWDTGTVVVLKVSFEVAAQRKRDDPKKTKRPFFNDENKARALFESRQSLYEKAAHITIDANRPVEDVAAEVVEALEAYWNS